jgi:nucleotide-binding universal stress UspA family protein
VALDASMPSRRALDRALGLFSAAEFTLVHAVEMPLEVGGAVTAPEEDEAVIRDLVEAKMARLEKDGRPLPAHLTTVIELGLAIDLVPAQARLTGADLAVLGTHGRRGMERAFLGSVAATLLEILPCDVLAVR